ncbi:MAG TPA: M56 family metallopeptidase, partial [Candidatus Acidoferrum sp.]|nr:M56 family metallopeptidase [Candidatus Acidoferrum sp.]
MTTILSIAPLSPSDWAATGAPLANHLWQSTVFAGAIWLLTLLLRKNHAQSRYVLWLIASAKFLTPFSLLIGLGSHLPWLKAPAIAQPAVFLAIETLGEPFPPANPTHVAPLPAPGALQIVIRLLPAILLVAWLVGCFAVLLTWYLRWRRLNATGRAALPLQSGRELEALRRTQQTAQFHRQIALLLSQSALEPGILGIFRPALLLPAGISEKLTDAQLDSVIAHELCHVRRRDNLAAALHMLVEALFWFHPLVWWMGTRLVDERERACDEEVLRLGADPHVYAESILKVCKFYLEPPLFCAAGVTGSNLKKRIEAIMSNRIAPNLEWSKKLLLSTMGVAAVAIPIVFGVLHPSQSSAQAQISNPAIAPAFETVSIKPNTTGEPMSGFKIKGRPMSATVFANDRFQATNVTLQQLIQRTYRVQPLQVSGGPY